MRNLIPRFIQEQYKKQNYEGHFEALSMFVDVSGFTPMTQALMKEGHEGAEILAAILNSVFDRMVNAVYERGGFISVFAGDAFTAVFPLNPDLMPNETFALHVLASGEKIQAIFRRYGLQKTRFGDFTLRVKVGISCGDVHWGIVGREDKAYFFRGEAIDACAASEHHADKGDIIFDECLPPLIRSGTIESEVVAEGWYRLRKLPKSVVQQLALPKLPRRVRLSKKIVSRFLPDVVINFKELGEFRPVVPIFISFEGISTIRELDDWTFIVLENIKTFSGYFNHLDFGDKGGVVICGFGAPVVFEDMIDRALDFLLSIRKDLEKVETLSKLKFRAGVTYGIAYAGIAGGQKRCEYTFYGEVVNLSARFMMKADWGEFFVSEAVSSKTTAKFTFEYKGDLQYKGIAEPVPTHALIGRKSITAGGGFKEKMIGRRAELRRLLEFTSPIFAHKFAGIAYIYGEAGIGKSRLAYALQEELTKHHDIHWFNCPADQIVRKSFNPFTTFFIRYFDQSPENTDAENKARFEEKYNDLIEKCRALQKVPEASGTLDEHVKELIRTKSVIGAQIGLFWYESLWEQLDAKGKYENTLYAIKNFFLAHSLLKPVVLELRDGHWIDNDSLAVFEVLVRNIADYPLVILTSLRYNDDGSKTRLTSEGAAVNTLEVDLNYLSEEDTKLCAEAELKGTISEGLHQLFLEKTKGNPFFVQQIARYFVENVMLIRKDDKWQLVSDTLKLPETINAVLIARIDRLSVQVKEVVKVAAVIGLEFNVLLLSAVLKKDVLTQIKISEKGQIWEQLQELEYIFKHALLRDTAYEMQLRARLRELHQLTGEAIETLYAGKLAEKYADLAFHYEKAEISDKAIDYLEKAGDQAKERYQNQQALGFYDRLLSHIHEVEESAELEIDTLLKKSEVLEVIGDWKECRSIREEALRLARQREDHLRLGQANLLLGILFRRIGQYDEAMSHFKHALGLLESVNEKKGLTRTFIGIGIIHRRKGDANAAIECYEKALEISEKIGDTLHMAKTTNNIGVVYQEVKYDSNTALMYFQKSLQFSEILGEKLERTKALNNLGECYRTQGNYDAAMSFYNQALQLSEELGAIHEIAINLGNIGHVHKAQGNYDQAIISYNRAIAIERELGNKYYLDECLISKANALFALQQYEDARVVNQEGLQLAEEIGRKEYIIPGNVLSAKIAFTLGDKDISRRLEEILQKAENDVEAATLHYELWKMTSGEDHRKKAFDLYQTLYNTTPNIEYKTRIEELQNYTD